ncbi:response regulator [Accumulibacter sp.]|uniref:hybrid sensor histidine kinase/response regulator n=1 Tax=Accumulibacter sp. TaxID=2053492 RepID=UPI001A476869|nr:response regulator [Accumulibacter sp.]MBL8373558.1 response regulator [Accumulibacter sp.]
MKNQLWHILIIDDSPDDRADLRQMLLRGSDRRYRFSEAELGADGLRQLQQTREGPYDCILLDYSLPDMNAEELLAAFCAGADLPPCPVVVVTGSGRADGRKLLRAGAQDYIGKDWTTPESLTRAVENSRERFALLADRAEAREVLRTERERLDLALTYGNMGIYEWHMVDDRLWWSAELYRVFGVTPETFIPTLDTFSALLHPDDREVFWQNVAESIAQRQPFLNEFRIVPPDGKVRWIADRGQTEYDAEGRGLRHFGVAFDVTEGKVAEAKLIEAKVAAEIANNAKSDFLSSMSHELRTPLHAILGFAQLIDLASPPPTPAQKRSIDQVLKAGWHLLGLINEVLDLALIESGKLSLSMEPVALAEVLRDCEAMVEPEAQKHGISVAFAPFAAGCSVNADPTRLKQVVINLLSNAIKYNKLGGAVCVTCTASPPESIRISVRDTGEGLAPEQLAQLFQPFNRLGHKGTGEEGTGIGLVVCKRLVDAMNGRIGVESTVGLGSVFWVELRLTTEAQAAGHAAEPAGVAQEAQVRGQAPLHTLLYVEDNPANLMLVEEILLRRNDIRLLSARNANQGIRLARSFLPDVILMDVNLPDISGRSALKILADDPATAHIPVLALSADANPDDIDKGLLAGFFRYLTKPIKVNEFMKTLDVALRSAKTDAAVAAKEEEV